MQPAFQVVEQRFRVQLACGTSFVRRLVSGILLDGISSPIRRSASVMSDLSRATCES